MVAYRFDIRFCCTLPHAPLPSVSGMSHLLTANQKLKRKDGFEVLAGCGPRFIPHRGLKRTNYPSHMLQEKIKEQRKKKRNSPKALFSSHYSKLSALHLNNGIQDCVFSGFTLSTVCSYTFRNTVKSAASHCSYEKYSLGILFYFSSLHISRLCTLHTMEVCKIEHLDGRPILSTSNYVHT